SPGGGDRPRRNDPGTERRSAGRIQIIEGEVSPHTVGRPAQPESSAQRHTGAAFFTHKNPQNQLYKVGHEGGQRHSSCLHLAPRDTPQRVLCPRPHYAVGNGFSSIAV